MYSLCTLFKHLVRAVVYINFFLYRYRKPHIAYIQHKYGLGQGFVCVSFLYEVACEHIWSCPCLMKIWYYSLYAKVKNFLIYSRLKTWEMMAEIFHLLLRSAPYLLTIRPCVYNVFQITAARHLRVPAKIHIYVLLCLCLPMEKVNMYRTRIDLSICILWRVCYKELFPYWPWSLLSFYIMKNKTLPLRLNMKIDTVRNGIGRRK